MAKRSSWTLIKGRIRWWFKRLFSGDAIRNTPERRDPDDEFVEWAFEQAGKNPLSWRDSAETLIRAARLVGQHVAYGPEMMDVLAGVEAMLVGYGLECLLKAMWIKRHKAWSNPTGEGSLTKDGAFVRIPNTGDHKLHELAVQAQVSLSHNEKEVLQKLSRFVLFAGRYPIATNWQEMKKVTAPDGHKVSSTFITKAEMDTAYVLAERLTNACLPWK